MFIASLINSSLSVDGLKSDLQKNYKTISPGYIVPLGRLVRKNGDIADKIYLVLKPLILPLLHVLMGF